MSARLMVRMVLALMTAAVLWNLTSAAGPRHTVRTTAGCVVAPG